MLASPVCTFLYSSPYIHRRPESVCCTSTSTSISKGTSSCTSTLGKSTGNAEPLPSLQCIGALFDRITSRGWYLDSYNNKNSVNNMTTQVHDDTELSLCFVKWTGLSRTSVWTF